MRYWMRNVGVCAVFLLALLVPFHHAQSANQTFIRVAVVQKASTVSLGMRGFFRVVNPKTKRVLYQGRNLKTTVTTYPNGILVAGKRFALRSIMFIPDTADSININQARFGGYIEFIKTANNQISVINHIELEDYIKGILYHEVSHYWPVEVLKAQAVVSRTYALNQMKENANRDFDVTADIYSQVYGGKNAERFRTSRAVEETQGQVLVYRGMLFPAYFHATCAGSTEDAGELWNNSIAPLKGVHCDFCKESPHYSWDYSIAVDDLIMRLQKNGNGVLAIAAITISSYTESGRVRTLEIDTGAKKISISAKDLRLLLGSNNIRSTRFTIELSGTDVIFHGKGWGHGVGMCQWGAYFQAKAGKLYREILRYYYPGSELVFDEGL